jgi:hypothetical protein
LCPHTTAWTQRHKDTSETKPGVAGPAKRGWGLGDRSDAPAGRLDGGDGAGPDGLNANMLRRWVREHEASLVVSSTTPAGDAPALPSFVQLPMVADRVPPPSSRPETVDVQIHRGPTKVAVTLPMDSASAAWLREVLG